MLPKHFGPDDIDAVNLGMLILRVGIGVTFAAHGWNKFFGGGKIPGTTNWFRGLGMRPPKVHAYVAATTELGCGAMMALGFLTPLAAAGFVGDMVVAAYTVHLKNGFFIVKNGFEYNWVLILLAVCISTIGPFKFSIDYALGLAFRLNGVTGLLIPLLLGGLGAVAVLAACYRPPAEQA